MKTYIALLRGINVGGHKKLKMADLKSMMEELGFQNVVTYIQSGNVVFSAKEEKDLSDNISNGIAEKFGYEVPVLVKTADEIAQILKNCPFGETKKTEAYFMLLATPPKQELMDAVHEINYPKEEFVLTPACIYLHYGNGAGKAKLNNNFFEKKLGVAATTRNYNTLVKLVEISK
tara:strand:- start:1069 stop:1593 length:525 start_codon:yes stop_codon:yes gene_type:complete